jgi:hypothetical protein
MWWMTWRALVHYVMDDAATRAPAHYAVDDAASTGTISFAFFGISFAGHLHLQILIIHL